jgi:hypothetical protein
MKSLQKNPFRCINRTSNPFRSGAGTFLRGRVGDLLTSTRWEGHLYDPAPDKFA